MKKAIILGTRPEIIKMSPLIRKMNKQDILIHTNQHYSENLDKVFFDELNLRSSDYNLNVRSGTHGKQTGIMLQKIEKLLLDEEPDVVLVEGDTNSVLAGALAASKLHIDVAHIEAGLRSGDMNMPEEKNRIMIDHISDYLFAPTKETKENLLKENISSDKIYVVGNTIVDATVENKELSQNTKRDSDYVLLTMHRSENVDDKERFKFLIDEINKLSRKYKIIYPIHPRTKKMLDQFGFSFNDNVKIIEPQGYLDFLNLENNAKVIVTDSGGVQEEACLLNTPCVTIRTTTERPETISVGANMLMTDNLVNNVEKMIHVDRNWENPFGKDVTGKILEVLE